MARKFALAKPDVKAPKREAQKQIESTKKLLKEEVSPREFETPSGASPGGAGATGVLFGVLAILVVTALVVILRSLWAFTHPEINIALPNLDALRSVAAGTAEKATDLVQGQLKTVSWPMDFMVDSPIDNETATQFIDDVRASSSEVSDKLSSQAIADFGVSVCETLHNSDPEAVSPTVEDLIKQYQFEFLFKFPSLKGVDQFAQSIVENAESTLCPVE